MKDGPRYRSHTALKFTAGLLRVVAALVITLTLFGAFAASSFAPPQGQFGPGMAGMGMLGGVFLVVFGLIYAVMLWAFADVLILMSDADDAHRLLIHRIERLESPDRPPPPAPVPPVPPPPVV